MAAVGFSHPDCDQVFLRVNREDLESFAVDLARYIDAIKSTVSPPSTNSPTHAIQSAKLNH
jgi:hypothetical protein